MMKIILLFRALLPFILFAAPHINAAQTPTTNYSSERTEKIDLALSLTKISDEFMVQFIYEKSLLEGKTAVYKKENIKGKSQKRVQRFCFGYRR